MTFYIYVLSQELKESMTNGQLLLDFLCQPGPRVMVMDVQALRYERTMFAENLGALRLKWLLLQRELESQVCSSATKKSTTDGLFTSGPGCMFPENQVKGVFWNLIQLMLTRMKEPCYSPNINDLRLCLLRFVKLNRCITPVQTERGAYSIFMAGQNSRKSK